jgi:hypothetical protein
LTISDEEFEKHVEAAVSAIAEKHRIDEAAAPPTPAKQLSEKTTAGPSETNPRKSTEGESSTPRKSTSSYETDSGDGSDEKASMSGLLRSIQKPLSSIGRIFGDDGPSLQSGPARTPLPGSSPRLSPAPRRSTERPLSPHRPLSPQRLAEPIHGTATRNHLQAEDAAARQANAEAAEAQRLQRAEHENVVETLSGMFPDLDKELISDVVIQKNGRYVMGLHPPLGYTDNVRVGLAVDACLALSS